MPKDKMIIMEDEITLTLGTLGPVTTLAVASKLDANYSQDARIRRLRGNISLASKTAGEGPIFVGYAIDNSIAEISEFLVNDPQSAYHEVEAAESRRKVFPCWLFGHNVTNTQQTPESSNQRWDPLPAFSFRKRKDQAVTWWAFNRDGSALTTGAVIVLSALWQLRWERG